MTDVDLSQRRVVVTGASSGIGAAAVRRLFRMGAEVHSWGGRGSGPLP
jgi:NAD(P)-dependent dehydrogenase (short-subunit alcohol dehydrogenase family)